MPSIQFTNYPNNTNIATILPAATNTTNIYGNSSVYIANYTGNNYKNAISEIMSENNGTSQSYIMLDSGLWRNTSPITSVTFNNQGTVFLAYSEITLYGI